jgi:hypothetical protein
MAAAGCGLGCQNSEWFFPRMRRAVPEIFRFNLMALISFLQSSYPGSKAWGREVIAV